METRPHISVIVPVFDPGPGFGRCLDSIRGQSLSDIEILLVDDCGDASALEPARKAAREDARIRILSNPENLGAGPSRNIGISAAQGTYLAFVDADDYLAPDFLELLYGRARATGAQVVKGSIYYLNEAGAASGGIEVVSTSESRAAGAESWSSKAGVTSAKPARAKRELSPLNPYIRSLLAEGAPLFSCFDYEHTAAIYQRELVLRENVRYAETGAGEDSLFLLLLGCVADSFELVDEAFYYVANREDSLTHTYSEARLEDLYEALRMKTVVLRERGCLDEGESDRYAWRYLALSFEYLLSACYLYERNGAPEGKTDSYIEGCRTLAGDVQHDAELSRLSVPVQALCEDGLLIPNYPHDTGFHGSRLMAELEMGQLWLDYCKGLASLTDEQATQLRSVVARILRTLASASPEEARLDSTQAAVRKLRAALASCLSRHKDMLHSARLTLFARTGLNISRRA